MNTATETNTIQPAPWLGRAWEWKQAGVAGIGSLILCSMYAYLTGVFAPDFAPGWIDFVGTMTSLWCVWITQKRNVLSLPLGIISAVFMGYFFLQIELIGQSILHLFYYLPVQFWAWYMWTRGDGGSELKVTRMSMKEITIGILVIAAITYVLGQSLTVGWDDALYTYWDASIVAASVVAMLLLSTKRVESWILWILPVNVSAIGLYYVTGAYMFAALYCLFLVMAFVGLYRWNKAAKEVVA